MQKFQSCEFNQALNFIDILRLQFTYKLRIYMAYL